MNLRTLFHGHSFAALFFCIAFLFSIPGVDFQPVEDAADTGYELTPRFVRFVSGGWWPVVVDWEWLKTVQDLGEKNYGPQTKLGLEKSYRLIQGLDPFFYDSYDQGAIAFMVLLKDSDAALRVLDRGIRVFETGEFPKEYWRQAYVLYLLRASVHGYLKQDFVSARRDFLKAAEVPGAPAFLEKMKIWLEKEGSESILAGRMLRILISNTKDPVLKSFYEEQINRYEHH